MNVMKRDQVHPKAKKGDDITDTILARTQWHEEKDMVIYSLPPLLLSLFGFKPIYGLISDPKVKADFEAMGVDQAFWTNTTDQAFINKADIDKLWDNLQRQKISFVGKEVKIIKSTPSVIATNITEEEFPEEVKMLLSRLGCKKKAAAPSAPRNPDPPKQVPVVSQKSAPQKIK